MNVWPRSQPTTIRVGNDNQVVLSFALTLFDEPSARACNAVQNRGIYVQTGHEEPKFEWASEFENLTCEIVNKRYFVHYCTMGQMATAALNGHLDASADAGGPCGYGGVSRGSAEVISRYVYASCLAPSPCGWQALAFCVSLRRASCPSLWL